MTSAMRAASLSIMAAMLGACGSGGGGGGGGGPSGDGTNPGNGIGPRTDLPFTSFSAVQANQNVTMSGSATTISGTQQFRGPNEIFPGHDVFLTQENPSANGAATLALGFDGQRSLSALAISGPEGNVSFDRSAGHNISCRGGTCTASNATASAITVDPFTMGWNYQTFGVWATQSNPTTMVGATATFVLGAVSAGNATPGNAIPVMGTASFHGRALGHLIDAPIRFTTDAIMRAQADFQNRTIGFTTTDTMVVHPNTGVRNSVPDLDLVGTFSWTAGVNNLSGPVQTRAGGGIYSFLSGSGSGRFYGPGAQEIGGTYDLGARGGGRLRMIGGFGGQRGPTPSP